MNSLLLNAAAGAITGALSGLLVVLGQAFILDAPEASFRTKRSLRYYIQRFRELRGQSRNVCPKCWRANPDPLKNPELLPTGWEDWPQDTAWRRCPECKHAWGVRNVITAIRPVDPPEDSREGGG